ncbi:MAG: hypothetical protein R3335_08330, partial [Anaerolineales bacterium]|nr:hypothetical protein [Anaerolineales bacterium]
IPLAIELAAARTQILTVEQIAAGLDDRFRLLRGGRRTALPRQQTLQALIDWSWNLLDEQEQVLLRRLAVFAGGWTLEAAEAVAGRGLTGVLEDLAQLAAKSVVVVDTSTEGAARYHMLESIREYARDRLQDSGEQERLEEQHADYYRSFAEEAAERLRGPEVISWLGRIRREVENIRKMLSWLLAHDPSRALTLSSHLFQVRGGWISPGEALEWLEAAMEKAQPTDSGDYPLEYGTAQIGLGMQLHNQGDYPGSAAVIREGLARVRRYDAPLWVARGLNAGLLANIAETEQESAQMVEESIRISREHDFKIELAVALGIAAFARIMAGDLEGSRPYAEEAIALAREYGNLWLTAGLLRLRGNMLRPTDAVGEAAESYLEALDKMEAIGDRHTVNAIRSDLADLYRLAGDLEEAERLYRQTILGWREQGHQPMLAHQLECVAYLAMEREIYPRAAELIGAAQTMRAGMSHESRLPSEITEFEEALGVLKEAMGAAEMEARIEIGARMSLDEAVAYARAGS